jgi:hypothetical protein
MGTKLYLRMFISEKNRLKSFFLEPHNQKTLNLHKGFFTDAESSLLK